MRTTHASLTLLTLMAVLPSTHARYCTFTDSCWPGVTASIRFLRTIQGDVIFPHSQTYHRMILMRYLSFTAFPGIIVVAKTTDDVLKSLDFARKHNIRVSVYSSGHDVNGRSTSFYRLQYMHVDGYTDLQINLSKMTNLTVNMKDMTSPSMESPTLTAGPGATWGQVYKELDKYKKTIVGANSPSVSVSGFTMGGGYGVFSRALGLAVDHVIGFTIILYNGTTVKCDMKGGMTMMNGDQMKFWKNGDLFWAVMGGGGGTYGVVVSWTFAIHDSPSGFVRYDATYPMGQNDNTGIGQRVFTRVLSLISKLPNEWSGYAMAIQMEGKLANGQKSTTEARLSLFHYGPWSTKAIASIQPLVDFAPSERSMSQFHNYSSFLAYFTSTVPESGNGWMLTAHVFIQSKKAGERHAEFFAGPGVNERRANTFPGCSMGIIGGQASVNNHDSAVGRSFREADITATCWIAWVDEILDSDMKSEVWYVDDQLSKLGDGSYLNEAAYSTEDWKMKFWGSNYDRLLEIKKKYDPQNVFTCHHCVGSDYTGDVITAKGGRVVTSVVLVVVAAVVSGCFAL